MTIPDTMGMIKLSSTFKGRLSTIDAAIAPKIAIFGDKKIDAPKNAKNNPAMLPSKVFFLLKGKRVCPINPPKSLEDPSPTVRIAIVANLIGLLKVINDRRMPTA